MMDENQMLSSQIMNDLNQYPILKSMVSSLIENLALIEKMLNILSLIKNNPLVRNNIKSNLNVEVPYPMNYPMIDPNQMMFPNQMMNPIQMMNQNQMMNPNQMMFPNQTMNQNQMMNPNQNFNQNQVNESGGIYVTFRDSGENKKPISFNCSFNDKVSDLIEKYRAESGDRDETKKFIYNAKALHPSITLSQAGVSNNSNIFVVVTKGVKGG